MSKTLTALQPGPVTFAAEAGFLILEVDTGPKYATATVEISGPDKVTECATARMEDGCWTLRLPGGGGGTTVIQSGSGSVRMSTGSVRMGGTMIANADAGRIIINGVDVTAQVSAAIPEPVRARACLPAGSSLEVRVDSGSVSVAGRLAAVSADTVSAGIDIDEAGSLRTHSISGDIRAGRITGPASASATSGDIRISDAAGAVDASAVSGDITVHATQAIVVNARSVSGDIRVSAAAGASPRVRARSVSGRVSTPRQTA